MQSLEIKTAIEKDTTLNFAVWQENRTCDAFLMHVGHLDNYKKAPYTYEKAKKAAESARAGLALLEETRENMKKLSKKKTKEGEKEPAAKAPDRKPNANAPAKAPEPKSDAKEAKVAPAAKDNMKASFFSDLEKAKQAQKIAKGAITAAAGKMFLFYLNLLSPGSKYAWNKIVSKQTESNPCVNLQGDTLEGPRGMLHQLFHDCVMSHLLTTFPINAAEQEKYYISNVLKKPQRVNVRQFVR
jgi:hypothetical protein